MRSAILPLAVTGVLLLACGKSAPAPTPTLASVTAVSTAASPAPASPSGPTAPSMPLPPVSGVPTVNLKQSAPAPLPEGLVIYYFGGRVRSEGRPDTMLRAYRLGGRTVIEDLRRNLPVSGTAYGLAVDADRQRIAILVCVKGNCIEHSLISFSETEDVLLTSDDGGVTWRNRGVLPPDAGFIAGFEGEEVAFYPKSGDSSRDGSTLLLLPSGRELRGPPGTQAIAIRGGTHLWRAADGSLFDASGAQRYGPTIVSGLQASRDGGLLTRLPNVWSAYGDGGEPRFIIEANAAGAHLRAVSISGVGDLAAIDFVSADVLLVNRYYPPSGGVGDAALLNLRTGEYRTIEGIRRDVDHDAYPLAAATGKFGRVHGTESCLNVREKPTVAAPARACFADGVLLKILDGPQRVNDGRDWYTIEMPGSGEQGFVAAEFIER